MESQRRYVWRFPVVTASLFCLLLLAQTVWGDYLLTLKSGLQLRVQTYSIDGSTIQLWTESGSLTLPRDIVMQITENQDFPSLGPRPSTVPSPAQVQNEQTYETHLKQRRHSPLYIPDEKSPHE
jgi:hypothetical protein